MPTDREIEEAAKTLEDADDALIASVDRWIALRQPVMGTAKQLKAIEAQEAEARFRLANDAALWAFSRRDPRQSTVAERICEDRERKLVEALRPFACDCADSEVGCGEYRYAEFSGKSKEACARWNARAAIAKYEKGA